MIGRPENVPENVTAQTIAAKYLPYLSQPSHVFQLAKQGDPTWAVWVRKLLKSSVFMIEALDYNFWWHWMNAIRPK